MKQWIALLGGACLAVAVAERPTHACGCFAPPDPTTPVLQAGERIVFGVSNGEVVAHIQIQYTGDAKDFGWLLPLPSLPSLELGTDELFSRLLERTQPELRMRVELPSCYTPPPVPVGGADLAAASPDGGIGMDNGPLVVQGGLGPYDYAVLKADDKQAMLEWLTANHYFIPVGSDDVVGPYLHPGAFFLALKLKPTKSAGDLQPVVLRYASDMPMIPLLLTSVTATPRMGVQVWVLGDARAIPRNYYHTVLDEAAMNWFTPSSSYAQLIDRAVAEAPGHHTFVTEFAGPSSVMKSAIAWPGRFGNLEALRQMTKPSQYVTYLRNNNYFPLTATMLSLLQQYIPVPLGVWVSPSTFYWNILQFAGMVDGQAFDPVALTDEIDKLVVKPAVAAQALFQNYPYLTELYTALSPEDMNRDPVFSFNPFLPDVSNVHEATLRYLGCHGNQLGDATLSTPDGESRVMYVNGVAPTALLQKLPASRRIEILRESGLPEVATDNGPLIAMLLSPVTPPPPVDPGPGQNLAPRGCSVDGGAASEAPVGWLGGLGLLVGLVFVLSLRRRRA